MAATLTPPRTASAWDTLASWIDSTKAAAALTDKDDGGKPATEGAHSATNSADVKKAVPEHSIENGPDNPDEGQANKPLPESGLAQATTGHMPEIENAVKTVTGETQKMSAADLSTDAGLAAALDALTKAAAELPALTARLGVSAGTQQHQKSAAAPTTPDATAAALGYTTKEAADQAATAIAAGYHKMGAERGELTALFMRGYTEHLAHLKQAAEDGTLQDMMAQGGDPGGAGTPPGGPGGAPPMAPPPDAGGAGAPPAPGGDPAAMGGAPPGGPPGAGGAPGGDGTPSVDEMAAAMAEAGISPDELEAVAAKLREKVQGAAGAGDMPPDQAKEAHAICNEAIKLASDVKHHMRAGQFRFKPAADGTPERRRRNVGLDYIQELRRQGA